MVWVFNKMFHGMGYSWDVPWDDIFLGHPNGMPFLGATLLAAAAEQYWEPYLGVTLGSYDGYNDD